MLQACVVIIVTVWSLTTAVSYSEGPRGPILEIDLAIFIAKIFQINDGIQNDNHPNLL